MNYTPLFHCKKCERYIVNLGSNYNDHPFFCAIYTRNMIYLRKGSHDVNQQQIGQLNCIFNKTTSINEMSQVTQNMNISTINRNLFNENVNANIPHNNFDIYSIFKKKTNTITNTNIINTVNPSITPNSNVSRNLTSHFSLNLTSQSNRKSISNNLRVKDIFDLLPSSLINNPRNLPRDKSKCIICQEDFKENDVVKTLPCLHLFNSDCISDWIIKEKKSSCPICFTKLNDKGVLENI